MGKAFGNFFQLISHALNWRRLQRRIALLLAAVLLFTVGSPLANAITFSGVLEKPPSGAFYEAFVHFNLKNESVVSLNPTLGCKDKDNTRMRLYSEHYESHIGESYSQGESLEPWNSLPLAAGNWSVKLYCRDYAWYEDPPTYTLTYSYLQHGSIYPKDSESQPVSTPNTPIVLKKGQAYSGWMGFMGYESIALDLYYNYRYGEDGSDCYYFNLKAGTEIQVRLEYDVGLNDSYNPSNDLKFYVLPKDTNYPYTLYKRWQKSGDLSKEIPLSKDGTYRFCVQGMPSEDSVYSFKNFPKINYGGYRMTVIVNGDDPLNPAIKLGQTYIITEYIPARGEDVATLYMFVPGEISKLIIPVVSDKARQIELVAGLSVNNGPIKPIGVKTCTVSAGYQNCYMRTDRIDKSIKGLRGELVMIAYIDNKKVAHQQQPVAIYQEQLLIQMGAIMELILD